MADSRINAVYIATPPDSHASLTTLAARAGKHVLCEKPMARNLAECESMISVCAVQGVSLAVAFYRRYFSVVQKMKSLVDDNAIGKPLRISATTMSQFPWASDAWRLDRQIGGGGFLVDMATHRFDLFAYFFGTATIARGVIGRQVLKAEVEDSASVALEFNNGVQGSAAFQWNTSIHRDTLEIVGTKGILTTDSLSGAGRLVLETDCGKEYWRLPSEMPLHLNLVQRFVEHLLDGAPNPCSGESAKEATRIVDLIYANA